MQITSRVRRKQYMADSELKEFLETIKIETEKSCWVTNYYKKIRGQASIYYKGEYIFVHQLSHLLFNNRPNLASIFRKCNNRNCFNPAHLTNDLKEKKFKLKMPGKVLLEGCSAKKDKKKILIDYGNWLSKKLGRSLVQGDFEVAGRISLLPIKKCFDSVADYFNKCDFPPTQRKSKITNSEMREFLKDKKTVTEKGCWVTDYWKDSNSDGRIRINYKGKMQLLYRVSYMLFKGNIPDGLVATHSCDNPPCYNPDHLFAKTQKRNMEEAVEKGRKVASTNKRRKHHGIKDAYDYKALLNFVKQHIKIIEKDEWIFPTSLNQAYPSIMIDNKTYQLHRLLLANKLGKKYDEIAVACHRLPDGSKPNKHDVNPDHLFEGTHSENMLDTADYSKAFKLDISKANQIKKAAAKSDFSKRGSKTSFDKEWAAKLNVTKQCITDVRLSRTWNL